MTSAEFYTPTGQGYGRFEARIMMPAGDGVVGAFFLWKDGSEAAGAYWNELDYEKIDANCTLQINSIYGAPSVQHQQIVSGFNDLCSAYHTYAYEWTPDHIAWSIDGQEVRRDTGAGAQAYANNAVSTGLQFRFNIWPGNSSFGGTFSASILPVYEYISWVQYSTYTQSAGNFALAWRESFEQGVPTTWAEGNWPSPFGLSTNAAGNVNVANGVAVLSLTADNVPGFNGTPPADTGDLPSVLPSTGSADASTGTTNGSDSGGGAASSGAGSNGGGGSSTSTGSSAGGSIGGSSAGGGPTTSASPTGTGAASSGAGQGSGGAAGHGSNTNAPGSAGGGAAPSATGSNQSGCAASASGIGGTTTIGASSIVLALAGLRRRRRSPRRG